MSRQYYVYILASRRNGTLYVGVTNNLVRRVSQHRHEIGGSFTAQYHVTRVVWYELHNDIRAALLREKRLKKWNRAWKLRLIEEVNPEWVDLVPDTDV